MVTSYILKVTKTMHINLNVVEFFMTFLQEVEYFTISVRFFI